jgi:molybdenum cofactor synthesis domain-containing protein
VHVLEASMIVVGDEILGGYVTDTNSPWLAGRLRGHGVPFTRVQVVPDTAEAIGEALQAELARSRPRLIVTSGGIGSTPDDLTYEAIAASLERELVENPVIGERIAGALDWSREQGLEVSDEFAWHLGRMARIPAGSHLLLREGGWAAGVAVDLEGGCGAEGATIVILPGVPSEFRALMEHAVEPAVLEGRNVVPTVTEIEHALPESALNVTFVELMRRWPSVKFGSYPGRPMLIRLTGETDEVSDAARFVQGAVDELSGSPAGERITAAWSRRGPRADPDTVADDDTTAEVADIATATRATGSTDGGPHDEEHA